MANPKHLTWRCQELRVEEDGQGVPLHLHRHSHRPLRFGRNLSTWAQQEWAFHQPPHSFSSRQRLRMPATGGNVSISTKTTKHGWEIRIRIFQYLQSFSCSNARFIKGSSFKSASCISDVPLSRRWSPRLLCGNRLLLGSQVLRGELCELPRWLSKKTGATRAREVIE